MISDTSLGNWLQSLASSASTPGGGAAAGVAGAQGAALIAMVARLTKNDDPALARILDEADAACARFLELSEQDMQCFSAVMEAWKAKASNEAEKAERRARLQDSLAGAAAVPLAMIAEAAALVPLAEEMIEKGNRNLITDIGIAARLLACVITSSRLNVLINLKSIEDDDVVARYESELSGTGDAVRQSEEIAMRIEEILAKE